MAKSLIVGLDVDGVLRGFSEKVMELAHRSGVKIDTPTHWSYLSENYIGNKTLEEMIWPDGPWLKEIFLEAPTLAGAYGAYRAMCSDPDLTVDLVTAQREGTEELTEWWLERRDFIHHRRTIYEHEKHKVDVDVLIDDKPENVLNFCATGRESILISRPLNLYLSYEPRTDNLRQAYKWIKINIANLEKTSLLRH